MISVYNNSLHFFPEFSQLSQYVHSVSYSCGIFAKLDLFENPEPHANEACWFCSFQIYLWIVTQLCCIKAADVIPLATGAGTPSEIWDDFLKSFQTFWSRFLVFLWLLRAILAVQSKCEFSISIPLGRMNILAFTTSLVIWREQVFCEFFDTLFMAP